MLFYLEQHIEKEILNVEIIRFLAERCKIEIFHPKLIDAGKKSGSY